MAEGAALEMRKAGFNPGARVRLPASPEEGTNPNPPQWFFVGEAFAVEFPLERFGGL